MNISTSILTVILLITSPLLFAQSTITYGTSDVDFVNPERGFYRYTETRSGSYNPLTAADLADYRNPYTPFGANYAVVSSLAFRYFFLEDFKNGPISAAYLQAVEADFAAARTAGIKLIPRFAYTDEVDGSGCNDFICPPYGDAPKSIVLGHIDQLAPILAANKDVIAVLQLGLIGTWGEGYYTDFFGDASPQGSGKWSDANWNDRNEVLAAVLQALPGERMVQIRYPQWKQRYLGGVNAPTSFGAITEAEAYSGTDAARIGFHNDCLLASAADFGTYFDYGNDAGSVQFDTANLKPYVAADSRYVPVGGETCSDGYSPQNDCSGTNGQAYGDTELRRMHYSYLNADYNNDVNNDWQSGGCMDDIKRSLGYRLELVEGTFPDQAQTGGELSISLTLQNTGYAAPFNPRGVELILRSAVSGELWRAELDEDPRRWWPGAAVPLNLSACLPFGIPTGQYAVLVHLPDPEPSLYGRADYSIRLAGELPGGADVWEPATGFNHTGHTVTISNGGNGCSATSLFIADNQTLPVNYLYFTATPNKDAIDLAWELAAAEHFSHFLLQRSTNGAPFTNLGRISGSLTTEHRYAFTDPDVRAGTTYFYRLQAVDQDGSTGYSEVVTAQLNTASHAPTLFPNPTTGSLRLNWPGDIPTTGSIKVYDALGRLRLETELRERVELGGLPQGVYQVAMAHGEEVTVRRVVLR